MKKGRIGILLAVIGMFIIQGSFSQVMIPKKCYMHLTGAVDREYSLVMDLVKNNDTVFGECLFPGRITPFANGDTLGELFLVCGKVAGDGNFVIILTSSGKPVVFTGRFTGAQSLSGTCRVQGSSQSLPFALSEKYPDGSTPMNAYFQKGSVALVRKPKSPSGKIQLSILIPGESANPLVSDSLKKIILTRYSGNEVRIMDPEKVLDGMKQVYFETYVNDNIDIYNQKTGQSFDWISLAYMHVVQNSAHLLSFYVEKYAFAGGANGLQTRRYTLVNMYTGKVIELPELFRGNYEARLAEILTRKAKEKFSVPAGQGLTSAGLFMDEIKPSSDFYVTRTGIGFYYNQYDIAPRAFGETDILIPYGEISDILASSGVLKELLR